jgi:hypothetical protein
MHMNQQVFFFFLQFNNKQEDPWSISYELESETHQPGMATWNNGSLQEPNPTGRDGHKQYHNLYNMLHCMYID